MAQKLGELIDKISIHALREEGDRYYWIKLKDSFIFLSTPSEKRATAKTETKSLFSYKSQSNF